MNSRKWFPRVALLIPGLLITSLVMAGCGPGKLFGPTLTPEPTLTPMPTLTPTATPSPIPTATPAPGPGVPMAGEQWEVTIAHVAVTESWMTYTPKSGYAMLILDVSLRNLEPDQATLAAMKDMIVAAGDGSSWTPAGFQLVDAPDKICLQKSGGEQTCLSADVITGLTGVLAGFEVPDSMSATLLFPIKAELLRGPLTFTFQDVEIPFELK